MLLLLILLLLLLLMFLINRCSLIIMLLPGVSAEVAVEHDLLESMMVAILVE